MIRSHRMPFGAEIAPEGVRFRLWAPSAASVELCLEDEGTEALSRMHPAGEGWFELVSPRARTGSRYRYRIDGDLRVPDPASRFNPDDVHAASEVIDPAAFQWSDIDWTGRPWEEAVIYELHVGSFSPEGTFRGVIERLDYLAELGVTAIELMPVADFPGRRNWGYDGVLPYAPDASYGRPEDLKALIQAAHHMGMMVLLDVVYNHFGPDGNYLHAYAREFFNPRHQTPWGAAINFDGPGSRAVRDFVIHNAVFWLTEYGFDGLRLDAVHAIADDSTPDILNELALAVRAGPGRERHIHLVLENDHNAARYLEPTADGRQRYSAQWNDDIHHAFHVLLTGERDGYYADYAERPLWHLGRCLTRGFAYQGEISPYRGDAVRGEPSGHLPAARFVNFLQTHDQVGNRAFGERLCALADPQALRAATAVLLLAPSPPLLFMGEEFGASQPFQFFCDFHGDLADAVRDGRRGEFARFAQFSDPAARSRIPDPVDPDTFARCRLQWDDTGREPHAGWLALYRELLHLRHRQIVPRLAGTSNSEAHFDLLGDGGLACRWRLGDGSVLSLLANLGPQPSGRPSGMTGEMIYATPGAGDGARVLPPWSVVWRLAGVGAA